MKKNPIIQMSILSAFILISFQLIACNCCLSNEKQDVVTQVREVVDFDGIIVSGAFNVFISQGNEQKVEVEAPEELMEKIQTDVKSGKLTINNKGRIKCYNDIKIFLTVKSLNSIIASGASDIKTQSLINATDFKLILSGAGDVDLNLSCDDLNCVVSGAGDAKLKGKTNDFTCVISGAGDLKAYDFIAEKCKIVISGSGDAKIYINNEISATVTGAGDLKYKGSAKITKQIVSGAGSIKKAD